MLGLISVAAGAAVANVFYLHPLLPAIGAEFGVVSGAAALVVTAGAVGYAAGLALLVPLGDVVDRRRLVVLLLAVVAVGQALSAAATSLPVLVTATAVLAAAAVVGPLLVGVTAALAPPQRRGAVTGTVLTGVLLGVLLARVGGGLLAEWAGGWRVVCAVAAAAALVLAAAMWRTLPRGPVGPPMRYRQLLASVLQIVWDDPVLQFRCLLGFLCFGSFMALWTALAFQLSGPPFGFGDAAIGMVALLGVLGVLAARYAGPLVDRGRAESATRVLLVVLLAGWLLTAVRGGTLLVPLLLGIVLLDLGVQAMQVTNMAVCLRRRPAAGSRITTAYMTCYFAGGIAGSAGSALAFQLAGWPGVCLIGVGLAGTALLATAAQHRVARRRAAGVAS